MLKVYTRCYDDFAAVVSGWLSCPDGLCRTTAQWVTHALFFKTLTSAEKSNGVRMSDKDRRFLRQVHMMIYDMYVGQNLTLSSDYKPTLLRNE